MATKKRSKSIAKNAAGPGKPWTAMFFLAADNDLGGLVPEKLYDLRRVGSTGVADVVAQTDGPELGDAFRRRLLREEEDEVAVEGFGLGTEVNTGDVQALIDFAEWARGAYPSHKRCLVLWSHGSSADPAEHGHGHAGHSPKPSARAIASARAMSISPNLKGLLFPTTTVKFMLGPDGMRIEYIGPDATTGDYLSNRELRDAIVAITKQRPLEILGLEACLMCTIEVAYQFRDLVTCLIASQSAIPRTGWVYDRVLHPLQNDQLSPDDAAAEMVRSAKHIRIPEQRNVTLSALRMSAIQTVVDGISALALAMIPALGNPAHLDAIVLAHHRAQTFPESETIDLIDFCRKLQQLTTADDIKTRAADLETAVRSLVIQNYAKGTTVNDRAHGVSISFPRRSHISEAYRDLDFAKASTWIAFLVAYSAKVYPPRKGAQAAVNPATAKRETPAHGHPH